MWEPSQLQQHGGYVILLPATNVEEWAVSFHKNWGKRVYIRARRIHVRHLECKFNFFYKIVSKKSNLKLRGPADWQIQPFLCKVYNKKRQLCIMLVSLLVLYWFHAPITFVFLIIMCTYCYFYFSVLDIIYWLSTNEESDLLSYHEVFPLLCLSVVKIFC